MKSEVRGSDDRTSNCCIIIMIFGQWGKGRQRIESIEFEVVYYDEENTTCLLQAM